jgi:hypothetical protein
MASASWDAAASVMDAITLNGLRPRRLRPEPLDVASDKAAFRGRFPFQ